MNQSNIRCEQILEEIREIDFTIVETVLYLDAYPDHPQALEYYHKAVQERRRLMDLYEGKCGPLTVYGNQSKSSWDWVKSPWPWESNAN
jgi:spore coat protein JB